MKIKITPAHRTEITQFRKQLADLLEANSSIELENAIALQTKLADEIKALEADGDTGEKAASALAIKRTQLERVGGKITRLETELAPSVGKNDEVLTALRQFSQVATAAVNPAVEAYALEATAALRPWCPEDNWARGVAYQLPAVISLSRIYSARFGDFGFNLAVLKAAIARADEILSGELNWAFDAKLTSK